METLFPQYSIHEVTIRTVWQATQLDLCRGGIVWRESQQTLATLDEVATIIIPYVLRICVGHMGKYYYIHLLKDSVSLCTIHTIIHL